MQTDPPAGVSASPIADNVMTWYAVLHHTPHATPPITPNTIRLGVPLLSIPQMFKKHDGTNF